MALYDKIGGAYNTTRSADPFIAKKLFEFLSVPKAATCLDVGCGTGNYLGAFADMGLTMFGLDPSETMLEEARRKNKARLLVRGVAEQIPFEDDFFNGTTAVLTFHHWKNLEQGLLELHRILKPGACLAAFSFTPEQIRGYWLNEYFSPIMAAGAKIIPDAAEMRRLLLKAGFDDLEFEPYFIQPGLRDHFLYSYKFQPEKYLDENVRWNSSAFSTWPDAHEIAEGCARLKTDIDSGKIKEVIQKYENTVGDYLFIKARKTE